jgi:putative serine protease PepD
LVAAGVGTAGAVIVGGIGLGSMLANEPTITFTSSSATDDAPVDVADPAPTTATEVPADNQAAPDPAPLGGDEPVAAVATAVAPSVVRIDTSLGTGSGIIADADGMIITNAHVVAGTTSVTVRLADGTRVEGSVVGADERVDVAVVDIDPSGLDLVPAEFAPWSSVETGQLAVAIGSPFGLEQTVTSGIVSAVNRDVANVGMIQTDAPINPGNSGGALADREGRVIGMNSSIRTDGVVNANVGVGFAIPSDTMLLVAERIESGEDLTPGFLGVSMSEPTLGRPGAVVSEVVPGSPAQSAGLEVGDLVVAFDGVALTAVGDLAARIQLSAPGATHELTVVRNDVEIVVTVTLGAATES